MVLRVGSSGLCSGHVYYLSSQDCFKFGVSIRTLMYAVVKTGGKQYRVAKGDRLRVETLKAAESEAIELGEVLMLCSDGQVTVGTPLVEGAKVSAIVTAQGRGRAAAKK